MKKFLIAPSILSADFARLGEDTAKVLADGADVVHFDVMDNHYVPNLTIGPMVCEALRKYGITAPIDVHLMVKPVDRIVPDFAKAGATYISFHPEASEHVDRTIQLIKENGCKAGLVFNPATPLSYLDYVMDKIDVNLRQAASGPQTDRRKRPRYSPGSGRRREGRQHCRDRRSGRGYVRGRLGHLWQAGLPRGDRPNAQ